MSRPHQLGLTLIELLISLVLSLVVILAAMNIFLTHSRTLQTTRSVGGLQDAAQTAYELMARDIREAGGNVCSKRLPVANVVNSGASTWWASNPGVVGYSSSAAAPGVAFGTATGNRINGTDAIQVVSMVGSGLTISSHNPNAAQFQLNTSSHDLVAGDILMVCDLSQASIMQMTGPNATNATVVHNTGTGSPGNCTKLLGLPTPTTCGATAGTSKTYGANAQVGRLRGSIWYVGRNDRGGNSLFVATTRASGGSISVQAEEVAQGVTDVDFEYLQNGRTDYVDLDVGAIADWAEVTAVRVLFTLQGGQGAEAEAVGTDGNALTRNSRYTITLRNRNP